MRRFAMTTGNGEMLRRGFGALLMSTLVVGCGNGVDNPRAALEADALAHDIRFSARVDTTTEVERDTLALLDDQSSEALPILLSDDPTPSSALPIEPPPTARAQRSAPEPVDRPAPETRDPPAEPRRPVRVTYTVPAGGTLPIRFDQTLSTRENGVGSEFTATLTDGVLAGDGTEVIPEGATLNGRVVDSGRENSAGDQLALAIEFTSISWGGRTVPISGAVSGMQVRLIDRQSGIEQAAAIGAGTVTGALLGRVIGNSTRSTIIGTVIGAAAGTVVALGNEQVDAIIDRGTEATIHLDRDLVIEPRE